MLAKFAQRVAGNVDLVQELVGENAGWDFGDSVVAQIEADQVFEAEKRFLAEVEKLVLAQHEDVGVGKFSESAIYPFQIVSFEVQVLQHGKVDLGDLRDDVEAQIKVFEVGLCA